MATCRVAALLALSTLAPALAENAYGAGIVWKYDPAAMASTSGYAYNYGERPSENVPWKAMAAENVGGNACRQTPSFVNVSCAMPPDVVTVTWQIQSVVKIEDIAQTMTLNTYLQVEWNDWRLMYVEGGVACWSASTAVQLSGGAASATAAAYLQAQLQPALLAAWGCAAPASCGPLLPAGVAPSVSVAAAATPGALLVTVFPATPAPGRPDPNGLTAAFTAVVESILAAYPSAGALLGGADGVGVAWDWESVPCTGADARRLPERISLSPGVGAATIGGTANPTTVDPPTIWDPEMQDSLNQINADSIVTSRTFMYANGDVDMSSHFIADFSVSMRLDNFPFDAPIFIATRRTLGLASDAVTLRMAEEPVFAVAQHLEGWDVLDSGSMVCHMQTPDLGNEATPCAPEDYGTAACHDLAVLWFKVARDEKYFLQNQLAPIVLVTILSASAFFNDLDAYELRCTIMATSLLSQMALQAYVSSSLPESSTVTFIHYALYTSYSLMGFGVAYIVAVSFGLATDIEAARKINAANLQQEQGGAVLSKPKRRRAHIMRMVATLNGESGVKHWQLRLYYAEAMVVRSILHGAPVPPGMDFLYFPDAPSYVRKSPSSLQIAAFGDQESDSYSTRGSKVVGQSAEPVDPEAPADAPAPSPRARADSPSRLVEAELPLPYCPKRIWLRRGMVEWDLSMRWLHLGIFALVIASRYFELLRVPDETVACDNLTDFFAQP